MPAKASKKLAAPSDPDPYVIVDFVFDRGLLSISIKNIGTRPAFAVRVRFSHKLMGCNGSVDVSALALFRALEFLPGGKEITTILDTSVSYFRSKQPAQITTDISYRDTHENKFFNSIRHNLEIYTARLPTLRHQSTHSNSLRACPPGFGGCPTCRRCTWGG